MKIDCISDTHDQLTISNLEFSDAETLIFAGDIGNHSTFLETRGIFKDLDSVPHKNIIFIPGNHDAIFENIIEAILISSKSRVHVLINDIIEIDGIRIGGSPYTPEFCGWHFMKEDSELALIWKIFKNQDLDILVTHGPPKGIMDKYENKTKCGSKTLLDALPEIAPRVHIFGHIHGAFGHINQDGIDFYNVSILNEQYVKTNPVTTITLEKKDKK